MTQAFNIAAAIAAGVAASANQTKASEGGGEYVPPAEGPVQLRFIGYIETGLHEDEYDGAKKDNHEVQLVFELGGVKHPPKVVDGVSIPQRMTIYASAAKGGYAAPLNEKATLYKLFKRMNWEGKAHHIAELLGQPFIGRVVHTKKADGKVKAALKDEQGFTIQPPIINDALSGTSTNIADKMFAPISPIRCFLWNTPQEHIKGMWDSLFIDGEYPASEGRPARSKNVFQDKIKASKSFKGSPVWDFLQVGSQPLVLGNDQPVPAAVGSQSTQTGATTAASGAATSPSDPLAGIN